MTNAAVVNKGDVFWCTHRVLSGPSKGTVIALTTEPGKKIGLQFEENIGGHSCDGRGPHGHCLWVSPEVIMTDEEYQQSLQVQAAPKTVYEELDSIVLRPS